LLKHFNKDSTWHLKKSY